MAKALISVEGSFKDLVKDFEDFATDIPAATEAAAEEQMKVVESAIKKNWASMVPWGRVGGYVYDSIGYNVTRGQNGVDVVGSVGVFHIDSVRAEHGYDQPIKLRNGLSRKKVNAPQLAYWAEFGFTDWNKNQKAGIPFMGNAFYATVNEQDQTFADTFFERMNRIIG